MALHFQRASLSDADLLGALNQQLIQDQGHRNASNLSELQERMRGWLATDYLAVIFEYDAEAVAYALYREEAELIYLRHFFVQRHWRRRGIGRQALHLLRTQIWPADKRLTVEILCANAAALALFRDFGFRDYSVMLEILPHRGEDSSLCKSG